MLNTATRARLDTEAALSARAIELLRIHDRVSQRIQWRIDTLRVVAMAHVDLDNHDEAERTFRRVHRLEQYHQQVLTLQLAELQALALPLQ